MVARHSRPIDVPGAPTRIRLTHPGGARRIKLLNVAAVTVHKDRNWDRYFVILVDYTQFEISERDYHCLNTYLEARTAMREEHATHRIRKETITHAH